MLAAQFDCATHRLFGLEFREIRWPSFYHPDARAWEVTRNGAHVAVFIGDYFARGSKRSGAWCSAMPAKRSNGWRATQTPHCGQCLQLCQALGASLACCPMTTPARCFTNSAMPCTRCCRM